MLAPETAWTVPLTPPVTAPRPPFAPPNWLGSKVWPGASDGMARPKPARPPPVGLAAAVALGAVRWPRANPIPPTATKAAMNSSAMVVRSCFFGAMGVFFRLGVGVTSSPIWYSVIRWPLSFVGVFIRTEELRRDRDGPPGLRARPRRQPRP